MTDIKLFFDGEFETTLQEIIDDNSDSPLCPEEIEAVSKLKPGQSAYLGFIQVTRIYNNNATTKESQ